MIKKPKKHEISKYKPAVLILVVKRKVKVIYDIDIKNLNLVIVNEVHDHSVQIFLNFHSKTSKAAIPRKIPYFKYFLCFLQPHEFFINFIHNL